MTQDDGGYELKSRPAAENAAPKPGEPGWVPPVPVIEKADEVPDYEGPRPEEVADIEQHKGMAILAYVCFVIPLLAAPKSPFARYHANQGLLVFILWCVAIFGNIFLWLIANLIERFLQNITILKFFLSCFATLGQIGLFLAAIALTIFGIIKAANGEKHPLPVLGNITLIK